MKRFAIPLVVVALAMMPIAAMAATLASGQQYSLPAQQQVNGNLYLAAGTATVGGRVTDDLFVAAGTVDVTGSVGGDMAVIGGNVQLLGPVSGDVRAAGGNVSVNDRIGGDFVVAGGTVHLLPGAAVQGDLLVAGGQVIIDGMVQGSVKMVGGQLTVNGIVNGDVYARAGKDTVVGPGARIGGTMTYVSTQKMGVATTGGFPMRILWGIIALVTGIKMLAMLGLGVLLIWVWRKQSLEVLAQGHDAFWSSLGKGFAYAILVPIAAILLLVSFVGSLAGVIIALVYIIGMILASVLAGMFLGSWLVNVFKKRAALRLSWWSGLLGIVLMSVLSLVPVVGWILAALLDMVMFGVVVHTIQRRISER